MLREYDFYIRKSQCPPKFVINTETGVTKKITEAYKSWVHQDMALLSLLIATLSDDVMKYVIGFKISHESLNLSTRKICLCVYSLD